MKRIMLVAAIMLLLVGGGVVAAGQPLAATQPSTSTAKQVNPPAVQGPRKYGTGGKISLQPPPGAWSSGGGPVDVRFISIPGLPLSLPVFGTDISASGSGGSNETVIASDPTRPGYFIAGGNGGSGIGRYTTTNGGQTWTQGTFSGIGDPAAAYDGIGNAYMAQLSTGTCPDPAKVYKSTDGGVTWNTGVNALSDPSGSDHFIDKEWMAADQHAGSPYANRVYVSATSFHTPPGCNLNNYIDNRMVVAYSSDGGATWSPSITVSDPSHNQDQFSNFAIANTGLVYYSYQYQNCTFSCNGVPAYQLITKSSDGGVSWSPSITITGQPISYTGASVAGYQQYYAGSTSSGFRHNDQAIIGVSPSNPNEVYAIWNDGRYESTFVFQSVTGWHGDIVFSRSTDGGATWSTPIKVNDDPTQGKDQFFPWMTVGSDGVIHASWMDRRDAPVNGFPYREYYSQSTDGGLTWSANQAVADVGTTPGSFIGDYSGLAVNADNSVVIPIWTDQRSGQKAYTDRGVITGGPTATTTPMATATATPPAATATATMMATDTPAPATMTATPMMTMTETPVMTMTATPAGSPTATNCPNPFVDINGNVFSQAILYLYCRGIVNGVDATHYGPAGTASRAQFAKVVVLGFAIPSYTPATPDFTDVPITYFAYSFIEAGYHAGILNGYDLATCTAIGAQFPCYGPNRPITRAQLTKLVVVAGNCPFYTPTMQTFSDVGPGNIFYVFIESAHNAGVINGYPDNTFRPNNNIRRDEMAQIVYKAILNCPGQGMMTPTQLAGTPTITGTPIGAMVMLGDFFYSPQTITVTIGTTVTWMNGGSAPHTVTADDNTFASGNLDSGQSYSHQFTAAGTIGYHCAYHGAPQSGMYGTIVVQPTRREDQ